MIIFKGLKRQFIIYILIPTLPLIILISALLLTNSVQTQNQHNKVLRKQAEIDIINSLKLTETAYQMLGSSYHPLIRNAFKSLENYFFKNKNNLSSEALADLTNKFEKNLDFFIINKSGVLEYSSYKPSLGLDFTKFPEFWEKMQQKISSGQILFGLLNTDANTGALRKWAYLPLKNENYILEVGIATSEFSSYIDNLKYTNITKELEEANPIVNKIEVYDEKYFKLGTSFQENNENLLKILKDVKKTKKQIEIETDSLTHKFIYVKSEFSENFLDNVDKIIHLAYDKKQFVLSRRNLIIAHLSISFLIIIIVILAAVIISGKITKPINEMILVVNKIAKGVFKAKIRRRFNNEIDDLINSINLMTENLDIITVSKEKLNEEVTYRKKSEQNLKKALQQIRAIFHNNTVGIIFVKDRKIVKCNNKLTEMLGYETKEMEGESTSLVHASKELFDNLAVLYEKKKNENGVIHIEYPLRHKDGHLVNCFLSGSSVTPDSLDDGIIWIVNDMSELKSARNEIIKLERKNSVLAMIATTNHEINQPLTSLLGNIELLEISLKNSEITEKQKLYFERIGKSVKNIKEILTKYRTASKFKFTKYIDDIKMIDFNLTESDVSFDEDLK